MKWVGWCFPNHYPCLFKWYHVSEPRPPQPYPPNPTYVGPSNPLTVHTYRRHLLYSADLSSFRCTSPTTLTSPLSVAPPLLLSHAAILTASSLSHANPFPNPMKTLIALSYDVRTQSYSTWRDVQLYASIFLFEIVLMPKYSSQDTKESIGFIYSHINREMTKSYATL
jgi:hypothetical protein